MSNDYKERMGGLANRLKSEQPKTPIQEVKPVAVKEEAKIETAQLNVWIPKDLVKRMKSYGIESDLSLKDITTQAIEAYLKETVSSK
jgi:hypothetical protein